MKKIELASATIDNDDIDLLADWLKTYPRLTKGSLTKELEQKFAKWLGTKHSLFVNSGSSANLLMLYALIERGDLKIGDSVLVPALSWSTDMAPVIQLGLIPVLVDCNLQDLSIDFDHLKTILNETETNKPKALILVSVLGLVPDTKKIVEYCEEHNIIVLEDNCESMGSEIDETKLGNFGLMSSYSTYFGHHISTIEGGFVATNDEELYDILLSIRSHGWDRDLSKDKQEQLRDENLVDSFQALYTFYYAGFNLRSTDLQAFIGLGQLAKLKNIVTQRSMLWEHYYDNLSPALWKPKRKDDAFISPMAYPIITNHKDEKYKIIDKLEENKVEARPLICGSLGTQPYYKKRYGRLILPNANRVDSCGLYVPLHPEMTENDVIRICNIINGELQ